MKLRIDPIKDFIEDELKKFEYFEQPEWFVAERLSKRFRSEYMPETYWYLCGCWFCRFIKNPYGSLGMFINKMWYKKHHNFFKEKLND